MGLGFRRFVSRRHGQVLDRENYAGAADCFRFQRIGPVAVLQRFDSIDQFGVVRVEAGADGLKPGDALVKYGYPFQGWGLLRLALAGRGLKCGQQIVDLLFRNPLTVDGFCHDAI